MSAELYHGDALDVFRNVRGLASIVSDPPGGGSFMGLAFDASHGGRDRWIPFWAERFKAAREATERGAWGLFWAFGRTAHWTACALDDAGWEIVRPILHVHGQGWAKAKSQLKPAQEVWWLCRWGAVTPLQIDRCRVRRSWAERPESWFRSGHSAKPDAPKIAAPPGQGVEIHPGGSWAPDLLLSHCPACRQVGVRVVKGSSPASGPTRTGVSEPITRGRMNGTSKAPAFYGEEQITPAWECLAACVCGLAGLTPAGSAPSRCPGCSEERWWACSVAEVDAQSGNCGVSRGGRIGKKSESFLRVGGVGTFEKGDPGFGDSGGASRYYPCFHYDAKASTRERQAGCEELLWVKDDDAPIGWRRIAPEEYASTPAAQRREGNVHATIKPIGCGAEDGLMRWLVRLITPPGGRVGDITLGSGSTGVACQIEGHDFVGCDIDPGAVDIARARLAFWTPERHRQVLADPGTLKAHEPTVAREKSTGQMLLDELPLFARSA